MTFVRRVWIVATAMALGCSSPTELSVDVRTDLQPGEAFDLVEVELEASDGTRQDAERMASAGSGTWAVGQRVADFRSVPSGPARVSVSASRAGVEVLRRRVEILMSKSFSLTVTLDATCAGHDCSGERSECALGTCVSPSCGSGVEASCGVLSCTRDLDCVDVSDCSPLFCQHGACVCDFAGGEEIHRDADTCACQGGETDRERRSCASCPAAEEVRTRACGGCEWEPWGPWAGCGDSCVPDDLQTESRACGNCNRGTQTRTRTCQAGCGWSEWSEWGACVGGGDCAPGERRTGCDPCGEEICGASCVWSDCAPIEGAECLRIREGTSGPPGNNFRCCGTNRWQFCLDTCRWSTDCANCGGDCAC